MIDRKPNEYILGEQFSFFWYIFDIVSVIAAYIDRRILIHIVFIFLNQFNNKI